jgi:hypothetical protein
MAICFRSQPCFKGIDDTLEKENLGKIVKESSSRRAVQGCDIVLIPFEHGATFGQDAMNLGALFAVSSSSSSSYMNGRRLKRQKIQTTQFLKSNAQENRHDLSSFLQHLLVKKTCDERLE